MHQVPAEKAVGRSRLQPGKQSAAIHGWCRGAVRLRGLAARPARLAGRAKTAAQSQQRTRRHGRQREVRVPAATRHRSGGCAEGPEQRTRHVAATQEWYPPAKPKTLRAHAAPRCADQDLHGEGLAAHEQQLAQASPAQRQQTELCRGTDVWRHHGEWHTRECWRWGVCGEHTVPEGMHSMTTVTRRLGCLAVSATGRGGRLDGQTCLLLETLRLRQNTRTIVFS